MDPLEADDPRVIGDFRLQARLGAGGMGRVYLGFSPAGRAVAIKVIHPHLARDPAFGARFQREVAAAQAVNAVYAAPVVAAGPEDTPPWLATAFVPAPSLQDVVATAGPLPEEAVWKLAAGLAEALRAVHASGLVHRDLKPGNVLLAVDGPRLIDFGIAQVIDGTRLTTAGGVVGTPSYMSPEQAKGGAIDAPSDVFSLGGVVYFAATGQTPFGGGAPASLLYKIVFDEPNLDGLSPQLRSLVASCLVKDPAARPTPARLANALMPAMPGGQFTPSRVAFWPEPVERFINDYRLGLDQGAAPPTGNTAPSLSSLGQPQPTAPSLHPGPASPSPVPTPPPGPHAHGTGQPFNGWPSIGPPTVGRPVLGAATVRAPAAGGRHARSAKAGTGLDRRRALAALAGAVTASLGIAGWETAAHAGQGKPTAPAFSLPKVAPGKVAWNFNANGSVSAAAQAGNTVYVATNKNAIYALNATTGKQLWKSTSTSQINDSLLVAGDSLVISGSNGPYGLTRAHGKPVWSIKSDVGDFPMQLAAGRVYVAFAAKTNLASGVTALDPGNGNILWTFAFGENDGIAGKPTVAGGVLYITTDEGKLFALSAVNGGVHRQVSGFGKFGYGTLAIVKGVVYAALDDKQGTIAAIDMTSGKTLWQHSLGPTTFPPYVATSGGLIYAGTLNGVLAGAQSGTLYALDPATGKQRWSVPVTGGLNEGPIAANGVIYTGSGNLDKNLDSGTLQAWQAATGKPLWSYSRPDSNGSIAGVADGRVYFGANGYLYALGA